MATDDTVGSEVGRQTDRETDRGGTNKAVVDRTSLFLARFITGFAGCLFDIRNDRQGRLYEFYPEQDQKAVKEGVRARNFVNVT